MTDTENIHQSILKVSAAIGAIGKEKLATIKAGSGTFTYKFRGIDDVLEALHPALIECGVTITPQVQAVLPITDGFLLTVDYVIGNVHGDTITATFIGEGKDRGDKSAQKAQSNAYKYMAFLTFCIPVDASDSDNTQYEPSSDQPTAEQRPDETSRNRVAKDAAWKYTNGADNDDHEAAVASARKLLLQASEACGYTPTQTLTEGETEDVIERMGLIIGADND